MSTRNRKDAEANQSLADGISEIPAKLLLIVSAQNQMTAEVVDELKGMHKDLVDELKNQTSSLEENNRQLVMEVKELQKELSQRPTKSDHKILMDELKDMREEWKLLRIELKESGSLAESDTMEQYATSIAKSIAESIQTAEENKRKMEERKATVLRQKKEIGGIWKNKLNARKRLFFDYYRTKRTSETYESLLETSPPRMPRKFLPKMIENEDPEETTIRRNLSIEKFKSEIALLRLRSRRYEAKYSEQDTEMIKHLTQSFEEEVSNALIEEWASDCKEQEEISCEIFNKKENWFLNNAFENFRNEQIEEGSQSFTSIENPQQPDANQKQTKPEEPAKDVRKKTTLSATAKEWQVEPTAIKRKDNQKNDKVIVKPSRKLANTVPESKYNQQRSRPGDRNDFWNKSTNVDIFRDENVGVSETPNCNEFDVAVIDIKDPSMNAEIPLIPPASEVVLVPDTQLSVSQSAGSIINGEAEDEGNDFLFHAQGATAIGYHRTGNQ